MKLKRRKFGIAASAAATLFAVSSVLAPGARAQTTGDYPQQPIKLVVPFSAGSGTDAVARIVAKALSERLKTPVVVDNKAGANGAIAADFAARAAPDGYTLFMTTNTTHSANPSLMKRLPYDPVKDFTPVARMGNLPFMLVVNPSLPVKTVAELVDYAKANPGKLSYASGNSTGIVSGATLALMAGLDLLHVPYKSTPPAIGDVVSGQVSMMFVDLAAGLSMVKAGKLRALAVTTEQSTKLFPELPPLAATPVFKGFDITSWNGVFAPAGTPAPIVNKLNVALVEIVQDPAIRERLAAIGFDAFGSTPEELKNFVSSELIKWAKLIKDAGIEPQ